MIGLALLAPGCVKVQVEPPSKPIHVVMDVNIRIQIQRELESFFDFADEPEQPTTQPRTQVGGENGIINTGAAL